MGVTQYFWQYSVYVCVCVYIYIYIYINIMVCGFSWYHGDGDWQWQRLVRFCESGDLHDNTENVYRLLLDADESTPTQIEQTPNQTSGFNQTFLSKTSSLIY